MRLLDACACVRGCTAPPQVDSARLGAFTFTDLAAYMGLRPADEYDSEDEDEDDELDASEEEVEEQPQA